MGLVVCKYVPVDVWLGCIKLRVRSQQLSVATPQCEVHVDGEEQTVAGACQQCQRRRLLSSVCRPLVTVCIYGLFCICPLLPPPHPRAIPTCLCFFFLLLQHEESR